MTAIAEMIRCDVRAGSRITRGETTDTTAWNGHHRLKFPHVRVESDTNGGIGFATANRRSFRRSPRWMSYVIGIPGG